MGAGAEVTDGRVQYARNGSVRLAYRVIGDGDTPLVFVPGWVSNVDSYDDREACSQGWREQALGLDPPRRVGQAGHRLSDPVTELAAARRTHGRPAGRHGRGRGGGRRRFSARPKADR